MKLKYVLLTCMLMTATIATSAQNQQGTTVYDFNPHWNIQAQGGAQYTLGEVAFSDLLSPNAQLAIGYDFTSALGIRVAANAWQSKGGSTFGNDQFKWKWNYVSPAVDLKINLSNLIGGFKPFRVCDFSIFAGAGANIGMNNDEAWQQNDAIKAQPYHVFKEEALEYLWNGNQVRFVGRGGANVDFRITDAVSIGAEIQANVLNDHYNSKKAYNPDWYFNALVGVKINLGKTYTTRIVPAPEPEIRYVDKYVDKIVEKQVPCPEVESGIRCDIFFSINSTEITDSEARKIQEIAEFLKANPEAFVSVFGAADAGTGNDRINNRLAAQRAAVVVKVLIDKYGISANRISSTSNGSKTQPFAENDKNRVSICIAQ